MAGPRFHRVLLTTLAALVLCAALAPARAGATEESAGPVLVFADDIPLETQAAVRSEFERIQAFFSDQLDAGTADYTMYVVVDEESGARAYRLAFGRDWTTARYCNTTNRWTAGIVNLRCSSASYNLVWPHFAIVREHLAPLSSAPVGAAGGRARGPAWLEGAAGPYVAYRYEHAAGREDYDVARITEVSRAKKIARPLSSMATRDGFSADEYWQARAVGILAVEWLANRAGETALFEYYRLLPDSETWQEAFEGAFGIEVDEFYEAFEAYRTGRGGELATVLQPGWNMVGWMGVDVPASDLFDQIPALAGVSAWDTEAGRYQRRTRTSVGLHGLRELTPGQGLWLYVGGAATVGWPRPSSEDSVLHELHAGRNLVGWAGRDGTPIEDAVVRFGDTFVRASLWDASTKRYLHYRPGRESTNPLRELNHGDALWVELTEGARWWQSGAAPPPVTFLGEFTEERRTEIGESVDGIRAVFAERWGVQAAPALYVGDLESIAATYRRIRSREPSSEHCGDHASHVIFLRADCFTERSIAHEYFHALQHDLSAGYTGAPIWIIEGTAVYADVVYTGVGFPTMSGRPHLDEYADLEASRLSHYELPSLEGVAEYEEFHALPGNLGYSLGFLVSDWLAQRSSEQSLIDFFADLAGFERWQEAFESAFGIAVDDFYEEFEAHLAQVAPPLPHLTDDREEPLLVFVGDVAADTEAAVRAEFDAVQRRFRELGAGTADYTVYVGADRAALADAYVRVAGRQPPERLCSWQHGQGAALVNLDCLGTAPYSLDSYHFTAVRQHLAPTASVPAMPTGFDQLGPVWLREAGSRYIRHAYRVARGYEDLDASRNRESSGAGQTSRLLSSSSTWAGFNEEYWPSGSLSFLAMEWLAERASDPAIFEYYRLLPDSESWEEAFEAAFDLTVDEFYEAFEEYRAEVAPPLPHLTDDIDAPVLLFVGELPAATRNALREDFDAVQAFFRDRLGEASGDYTLYIGADARSLRDVYRQIDGRESTQSSYCSVPRGIVILISLQCEPDLAWRHSLFVLRGLAVAGLPATPAGYPSQGPAWLTSASHSYVSGLYRAAANSEALDRIRSSNVLLAAGTRQPLSSLATQRCVCRWFHGGPRARLPRRRSAGRAGRRDRDLRVLPPATRLRELGGGIRGHLRPHRGRVLRGVRGVPGGGSTACLVAPGRVDTLTPRT